MKAQRFVFGLAGPSISSAERAFFFRHPPFGFVLLRRNFETAGQTAALVGEVRALLPPSIPRPLLFVDQEGGTVDRLGPLLGVDFRSAATCAEKGADRVQENAYLMGRAARLLGLDVDFAPVLDLAQPGTGAVVLEGRCFGFHAEDVVAAATVFLHGLARAGVGSCAKHFPGLGRGGVDSHVALPVVDAHDVDLMVTDVAPFARLAKNCDGVMVGHAAYPGLTGDATPASLSPIIHRLLRRSVGFSGVVYSDDLTMGALAGSIPERAEKAAAAGCDVLVVSKGFEAYEEAVARVEALGQDPSRDARLEALHTRRLSAPRPPFEESKWRDLSEDVMRFLEVLEKPREKRELE